LNQYEILKELDVTINNNFVLNVENKILHKENDSIKTMIQMMNEKENEMLETYKIERMTVDALQEYLKSVDNDYHQLVNEADVKIQQLKKEVHQLKLKAHYRQKEIDIDTVELKQLKKNLKVVWKDCSALNNRVKELEITLETTEGCIIESKEEMKAEGKKKNMKEQEIHALTKQLHTLKEMEESMRLKEKEWEFKVKEVDKLKCTVRNLEYTLNLKQTYIDTLEKKHSGCGNAEIEAIFK